jgi:hypothetical protein
MKKNLFLLLTLFSTPIMSQTMATVALKDDCTNYLMVEKDGKFYELRYTQLSINQLDSMFFNEVKQEDITLEYTRPYLCFLYEYHLDNNIIRVYPDFASQPDHHFNYWEEEESDMIERVKNFPINSMHILNKDYSRNYCLKAIVSDGKVRFTKQ